MVKHRFLKQVHPPFGVLPSKKAVNAVTTGEQASSMRRTTCVIRTRTARNFPEAVLTCSKNALKVGLVPEQVA